LGKVIFLAASVFGLGLLWLSMALLFLAGMGMMMQMAASNTILQTIVDDDMRARVMSFYGMSFFGMVPLGSLMAGKPGQQDWHAGDRYGRRDKLHNWRPDLSAEIAGPEKAGAANICQEGNLVRGRGRPSGSQFNQHASIGRYILVLSDRMSAISHRDLISADWVWINLKKGHGNHPQSSVVSRACRKPELLVC
jgi:hypothetical protein